MIYVTLTELKQYLKKDITDTSEDALFARFLLWASKYVDWYKRRTFDLKYTTFKYNVPVPRRSLFGIFGRGSYLGSLDVIDRRRWPLVVDDLLELTQILNGDGTVIPLTNVILQPGRSYPKSSIYLTGWEWSLPDATSDPRSAIAVTGLWGYNSDYPDCLVDSLDTVGDNPLAIGATTLTVQDINGIPQDLQSPKFQAGQLLQLVNGTTTELVLVLSTQIVLTVNTLTIARHQNGSVASAFPAGSTIRIFRPETTITRCITRLADWFYKQKDVDSFDQTFLLGSQTMTIPASLPPDVIAALGPRKARVSEGL